jgi:hypothetical protein
VFPASFRVTGGDIALLSLSCDARRLAGENVSAVHHKMTCERMTQNMRKLAYWTTTSSVDKS